MKKRLIVEPSTAQSSKLIPQTKRKAVSVNKPTSALITQAPLTEDQIRAMAWTIPTVSFVGSRASGASTLATILALAAGDRICAVDSSHNIKNKEGTGFVQICSHYAEAQVLLGSQDAQAAGDLQPDHAVLVANLHMTRKKLAEMPKAILVAMSGVPRGPKQVSAIRDVIGAYKMVHVVSDRDESFAGSALRAKLGANRTDTSRDSLMRAWVINTDIVEPGVNHFEVIMPTGSLLRLWKGEDLRIKLARVASFIAPNSTIAERWINRCNEKGHPAYEEIESILSTEPLYQQLLVEERGRSQQERRMREVESQHHQNQTAFAASQLA